MYQKKIVTKKCHFCKKSFETSSVNRQIYCSPVCGKSDRKNRRKAYNKKPIIPSVCAWPACGKEFITYRSDQKYCCRSCLTGHYKELRSKSSKKLKRDWFFQPNFASLGKLKTISLDEKTSFTREEIAQETAKFLKKGGKIKKLVAQELAFEATHLYDEIEEMRCVELE